VKKEKPVKVLTEKEKKKAEKKAKKPVKVLTEKQKKKVELRALRKANKVPHKPSPAMRKKWRLRGATRVLEATLADQFDKGRLYARISSRPGQSGSADGYVLEGE